MNKFQAMAEIMHLLNQEGCLKPGTLAYRIVRQKVAERIDRIGPEAALLNVIDRRPRIVEQIKRLTRRTRSTTARPSIDF